MRHVQACASCLFFSCSCRLPCLTRVATACYSSMQYHRRTVMIEGLHFGFDGRWHRSHLGEFTVGLLWRATLSTSVHHTRWNRVYYIGHRFGMPGNSEVTTLHIRANGLSPPPLAKSPSLGGGAAVLP